VRSLRPSCVLGAAARGVRASTPIADTSAWDTTRGATPRPRALRRARRPPRPGRSRGRLGIRTAPSCLVAALLVACSGDGGDGPSPLAGFASGSSAPVFGHAEGGVVTAVSGRFEGDAEGFVTAHAAAFGLEDPASELVVRGGGQEGSDTWVSYERVHDGVPVDGARLRVHSRAGAVVFATAQLPPEIALDSVAPTLTAEEATTRAIEALELETDLFVEPAELVVYHPALFEDEPDGGAALAWRIPTGDYGQDGPIAFVDAASGELLAAVPTAAPARQRVVRHYVHDADLCQPDCNAQEAITFASEVWFTESGQSVDASPSPTGSRVFDYLADLYDYYQDAFGRDGWDGAGGPLYVVLDHPEATSAHDMVYLHGLPAIFARSEWVSRTSFGHEYAHGVIIHASGLETTRWAGALNEALADVFAILAEDRVVDTDWTIRSGDGTLIRDIKSPKVQHVDSRLPGDGPHALSGPFSLALWMLATGNSHPKHEHPPFEALTTRELEVVMYRAVTHYLQPKMGLHAGAHALVQACAAFVEQDLHGLSWSDCGSMLNAFSSVGLAPADRDLDAIPDAADNCPDVDNHDQDPAACLPAECLDAIRHFCSRIQGQSCDTSTMGPAIQKVSAGCGSRIPGGFVQRAESHCEGGSFSVTGCERVVASQ